MNAPKMTELERAIYLKAYAEGMMDGVKLAAGMATKMLEKAPEDARSIIKEHINELMS